MDKLDDLVRRLEIVTALLETKLTAAAAPANAQKAAGDVSSAGGGTASGTTTMEAPPLVTLYDEIIDGPLAQFIALSNQIGGDVQQMASLVSSVFGSQRAFVWTACGRTKPADVSALLTQTSTGIEAVNELRNAKRQSAHFNHLSAVSEAMPALGWVAVEKTPAPYVKEMTDASMFYTNRVLKDFKETDQTHVDWVKAWMQTLSQLQQYVRKNHTTGLVWNTNPGTSPSGGGAAAAPRGAPPCGGPPPPPPPPIPTDLLANLQLNGGGAPKTGGTTAAGALFAEINQAGLGITNALKKVSDDMKTHKNPALRRECAPPPIAPKPGAEAPQGAARGAVAAPVDKPPVCALEGGKKWAVEFQKGTKQQPKQLTIDVTDMKQTVYIYKCEFTVLIIKGKINSLTMDSCKKTSCVFDNMLSCAEVINCQSAQIQTLGAMPTLAIQKTDGCQVYLSKDSLNSEIITSKSSEMNILVPDASGEFSEHPIPEQFKTVWTGQKLQTNVVDIA